MSFIEKLKNNKLFMQILKFGVVGGLSAVIDFSITMSLDWVLRSSGAAVSITTTLNNALGLTLMSDAVSAAVGSLFGFLVSLIFNYFMSMKFVFERKDNMDRKKEFIIFALLSVIGLLLNTAIMYGGKIVAASVIPDIASQYTSLVTAGVKVIATGIVMVYNFISRKLTLEKKD